MARADLCPVCRGSGKYKSSNPVERLHGEKPCHGCWGRGWVEVTDGPFLLPPQTEVPWTPVPVRTPTMPGFPTNTPGGMSPPSIVT